MDGDDDDVHLMREKVEVEEKE